MAKTGKRKGTTVKLTAGERRELAKVARLKGVPLGTLMRKWSLAQAREWLKRAEKAEAVA